jgi:hypothetical protein
MSKHREIAVNVAAEFLSRSFGSGETIAILWRRDSPAETVQRIVPLEPQSLVSRVSKCHLARPFREVGRYLS